MCTPLRVHAPSGPQPGQPAVDLAQYRGAVDVNLEALNQIVGESNVLVDDDAAPALVDQRGKFRGQSAAVVRPANTDEVAAVMAWCTANDVCVATQGGNTGLSGGAQIADERPSIVVSLARMNTIEEVDADGWTMTVQAGVTIQAMQESAAAVGRKFAPDWGARGTATVGGGIATDAGGNNVVRYGNMRDQVLGLEAVLPDGRIWDGLRSLRKDSSGYDIKQLFIGSEGTLGIITRAVVKLFPATEHEQSALAALRDLDDLMDVFALANEVAPDSITAFELMAETGMARVADVLELTHPMEERAEFYVLVKFAGTRPVTDQLTEFLSIAAGRDLITDAIVATSAEQERKLWVFREEIPPMNLYPHQAKGLKMDTAVPIAKMGQYHDAVRAIAAELAPDAVAYGFGHVGDGNLHMMVLPLADNDVEPFLEVRDELVRRIDEATFALGGTLSAEHGVGRELVDRVGDQKPAIEWEMMRSIKATFDPDNRLNPGAVIPPVG